MSGGEGKGGGRYGGVRYYLSKSDDAAKDATDEYERELILLKDRMLGRGMLGGDLRGGELGG